MEPKQTHLRQLRLPLAVALPAPLPESTQKEVVAVVAMLLCQVAQSRAAESSRPAHGQENDHASEAK
jgi:hypothetical protein